MASKVKQLAMMYLGTNNREGQASNMMYNCLRKLAKDMFFAMVSKEVSKYR
jgi:hypothetical protein